MNMPSHLEVRNAFKEKGLSCKDEWLQECVEWALFNNPLHERTLEHLQEFAYQQWLLADFAEIGVASLPANLVDQKFTVLPGLFALQVESMMDVANSKYSQLKGIRGGAATIEEPLEETQIEGRELTKGLIDTQDRKQALRPRKLRLTLTDGISTVLGLEYRPLNALQGRLLPGFKVLVHGPVDCRRGVLMLEPKHLEVLGGEVDTKLISNATENVMARELQLPETPEPFQADTPTVPPPAKPRNDPPLPLPLPPRTNQPPSQRGGINHPPPPRANYVRGGANHVPPVGRGTSTYQPQARGGPSQPLTQRGATSQSAAGREFHANPPVRSNVGNFQSMQSAAFPGDDDDDFDITDEDFLALELDTIASSQAVPTPTPTSTNRNKPPEHEWVEPDIVDEDEYLMGVELEEIESQFISSSQQPPKQSLNDCKTLQAPPQNQQNFNTWQNRLDSPSSKNWPNKFGEGPSGRNNVTTANIRPSQSSWPSSNSANSNVSSQHTNNSSYVSTQPPSHTTNWPRAKAETPFSASSLKTNKPPPTTNSWSSSGKNLDSPSKAPPAKKRNDGQKMDIRTYTIPFVKNANTPTKPNLSKFVSKTSPAVCKVSPILSIPSQVMNNISPGPSISSCSRPSPVINKTSPPATVTSPVINLASPPRLGKAPPLGHGRVKESPPKIISGQPFVYLCQLQEEGEPKPRRAVVKATVLTLLSKMKGGANGHWELLLRISDGSANLDVEFSQEVIDEMLGFSALEYASMKSKMAGNPVIREKLTKGFAGFQQKLITLNCLMVLTFPPQGRPCVIKFIDINEGHLRQITMRSKDL